ncbi:MAG: O-phosphoseryl-tRNA(Sec) selenium transferase [Promethearchaeota archaeon]
MSDPHLIDKLTGMIPTHMIERAKTGYRELWHPLSQLLDQRKIPDKGWSDLQIRQLILFFNSLDSDKDPGAIRIGEREGRLSTDYLSDLSAGFSHGVGRSGELTAPQPKAAGASLMQHLTNKVVLSLLRELGLPNLKSALTVPFGTGMSLGMALRGALTHFKIDFHKKPRVLMTQIDHKSPRKGIEYIGGQIVQIPGHYGKNYYADEGVFTTIEDLTTAYDQYPNEIAAIVSSSAFFAPRVPDNLKEIAKFARDHNLIHIINHAYGVQSIHLNELIRSAIDAGRVDAIVQSTDKCFLTPVGGAVISSPNPELLKTTSRIYAGRASAGPIVHLLVSLLSMGKQGYLEKIQMQQENFIILTEEMQKLADERGEHLITCKNQVSVAMTLQNLSENEVTKLGGFLYNLRVTGPRIINLHQNQNSFGSCTTTEEFPYSAYIVMNAAIGVLAPHISQAILKLKLALTQISK